MCASMHTYIRIIKAGCYAGIRFEPTFDAHSLCYRLTYLKSDCYYWQTNHWFKVTLTIPEDWKQYERVQCTLNHFFSTPSKRVNLPCHKLNLILDVKLWFTPLMDILRKVHTSVFASHRFSFELSRYHRWVWWGPQGRVYYSTRGPRARSPWVCDRIQL